MKYFKLRVDHKDVEVKWIMELVNEYSDIYAYCIEGGMGNPHSHWYIELEHPAIFRKRLRDLGLKGNASYSLKECDERYPIEYLAYMLKEGEFIQNGIPDDQLASATYYNKKVQDEIKEKKEKKKNLRQKLEELCLENGLTGRKAIAVAIVQYHIENDLLIREFQIKAYVDTLYLKFNPNEIGNWCYEKFS